MCLWAWPVLVLLSPRNYLQIITLKLVVLRLNRQTKSPLPFLYCYVNHHHNHHQALLIYWTWRNNIWKKKNSMSSLKCSVNFCFNQRQYWWRFFEVTVLCCSSIRSSPAALTHVVFTGIQDFPLKNKARARLGLHKARQQPNKPIVQASNSLGFSKIDYSL